MKRFHDDFPSLLAEFRLEVLERDPNPIYGLSAGLALNYLNPGWFVFARENDGEPAISERYGVGARIGDAMAGDARDFYLEAFQGVLQTGNVWHHDYECSTPNVFRIYHQSVYPLLEQRGLLVVNSLVKEQPHDAGTRVPRLPREELYVSDTGFISQCSNCRRVQRVSQPDVWDWVPAWVEQMPSHTSYTFCPVCFEYYWRYRRAR
jgi:hypothetical protein